jgi:hypothetical protein
MLIFINTDFGCISRHIPLFWRAGKGTYMRSTGHLRAMGDFSLPKDVLVLHPCDGYDLGFLATHNSLRIYSGAAMEDFEAGSGACTPGTLHLKNDCALSTLRLSLDLWKSLGRPREVRLVCRNGGLLIVPE